MNFDEIENLSAENIKSLYEDIIEYNGHIYLSAGTVQMCMDGTWTANGVYCWYGSNPAAEGQICNGVENALKTCQASKYIAFCKNGYISTTHSGGGGTCYYKDDAACRYHGGSLAYCYVP